MFCSLAACLGVYVAAVWLYENFRTPVLLVLQTLKQLVFRQKLSQRYGQWAGECRTLSYALVLNQ